MKPLIVLLGVFLITLRCTALWAARIDYTFAARAGMTAMLLFTAIGHFAYSKGMVKMMPAWLPFRPQLVFITGLLEILAALLLPVRAYTQATGWFLVIFFIAMLPVNIHAALHRVNYQQPEAIGPGPEYLWFRVPLQLFFIAWVYWSAISI
jgi:uncharacterized membrane protein